MEADHSGDQYVLCLDNVCLPIHPDSSGLPSLSDTCGCTMVELLYPQEINSSQSHEVHELPLPLLAWKRLTPAGLCGAGKSCTAALSVPASLEGGLLSFQHHQSLARSGQGSSWPSTLLPTITVSLACPLVGDWQPAWTLV